jgi:hypothetical protein
MEKMKFHRTNLRNSIGLLAALVPVLVGIGSVNAATLSYTSDTNIYFPTPQITLTIQAGSAADGLTVNAAGVAITLSSSTGGTFALTSPEALSSSTIGSGGTLSQACSSGVETDTITQTTNAETYTLTPTGSACSQALSGGGNSGGGSSGGGSVGVASSYGTLLFPVSMSSHRPLRASSTTPAVSFSAWSLETELNALLAQLAELQAQAGQSSSATTSVSYVFTRNLGRWDTGSDVNVLQLFLISANSGPAAAKLKAHGATKTFGFLTYRALIEFQKGVGITPAAGYFGPKTRTYVNAINENRNPSTSR